MMTARAFVDLADAIEADYMRAFRNADTRERERAQQEAEAEAAAIVAGLTVEEYEEQRSGSFSL